MSKSRSYCFTINNYTYRDVGEVMFMGTEARYLVCGFEKGENGTPHIQGYVYFDNQIAFSTVCDYLQRAHFMVAKGTPEQNKLYCSKDGDVYEVGELPCKGKERWQKIVQVMEDPTLDMHTYTQYRKSYKEVINIKRKKEREVRGRRLWVCNENISLMIAKHYQSVSFDVETYDGEDVLILDAYTDYPVERWMEGFPYKLKRGYEIIPVDPQMIVLTYCGKDLYERKEDKKTERFLKKKYCEYIGKWFSNVGDLEEHFEREQQDVEEEEEI